MVLAMARRCEDCAGTGEGWDVRPDIDQTVFAVGRCERCHGRGEVMTHDEEEGETR